MKLKFIFLAIALYVGVVATSCERKPAPTDPTSVDSLVVDSTSVKTDSIKVDSTPAKK